MVNSKKRRHKMASDWKRSICGLLLEDVIPVTDTGALINDAVVSAVNIPIAVFAFVSNLVAIVAVVKTPSLHKPSNILLCSLAFTDLLTGVITQPLLIARRVMVHRAHISCDYQLEMYIVFRYALRLTTLLALVNVTVMSFDRYSALSEPLQYRANASNKGTIRRVVIAGVTTALFTLATEFIFSSNYYLLFLTSKVVAGVFVLIPIINHVRMFISLRQHRSQVVDAMATNEQRVLILKREKKVAYDMMILSAVLVISYAPAVVVKGSQSSYTEEYRYLFPWALSLKVIKASIDPMIYFWRNKRLRNAMKSFVSC